MHALRRLQIFFPGGKVGGRHDLDSTAMYPLQLNTPILLMTMQVKTDIHELLSFPSKKVF